MDELIPEAKMTVLRGKLLDHISQSEEAYFKSQQVGEPDLTNEEKREIAEEILNKSKALFLARFGKFLLEEHLKFFNVSNIRTDEDYEIAFHLQEIRNSFQISKNEAVVKNRRLEALKRLALEGEYFSEEEMKRRNPLLYEQLVGRFLTDQEKKERLYSFNYNEERLSHFLLEKYDQDEAKRLLRVQQDHEDSVMEEEEDSSEEEDNKTDEGKSEELNPQVVMWGERNVDGPMIVSDVEKNMFFEEFRSHMYSTFLQGKDYDFDYSKVDSNMEYDDLDTVERDEEEKYFDSESAEEAGAAVVRETNMDEEKTQGGGEDPLDAFMSRLEEEATQVDLNTRMESLGT